MVGSRAWVAVRVRSNFEAVVCCGLQGKGFDTFVPTYQDKRTWSDRTKVLDRPLFPGYLFCQTPIEQRLPILTTPGVRSIVGFGKIPAPVPDAEIQAIQRFIESDLNVRPWPFLRCGQRVVIEKGPLAGVDGILEEFKGKLRVVVSVTLLQRSISAEVDGSWVRALEDRDRPRIQ